MATNSSDAITEQGTGLSLDLPLQPSPPIHWPLHENTLIRELESAQKIDRASVVNMLNYIHFVDGAVLVHLRYLDTGGHALVHAYPRPCSGKTFSGYWSNGGLSAYEMKNCRFLHLIIEDGKSMIFVPVTPLTMTREAFEVQLPETSYAVGRRQAKRHVCRQVNAELVQNNLRATGHLLDFNPFGFRIMMTPESSDSFDLFDFEDRVAVHLSRDQEVFFSGLCRCLRHGGEGLAREVVMTPETHQINRFKRRLVRNPRQHLSSAASIVFEHPFLKKRIELEINDISTSGFSVWERDEEGMLMPGMIIPEVIINHAGLEGLKCTAQVIYRTKEGGKNIRCGLAILDMDVYSFSRLAHVIANTIDSGAHISTYVNISDLWRFFFDSGFINSSKYNKIYADRENFKAVYRKLYLENPEIARHFIYKRKGVICGHISMVRAYERAWIIHHHAARSIDSRRGGFMILRQLIHYVNDMHRLPSLNSDFVFSYFRPENVFPNTVFGGFAMAANDPNACSMDLFSYSAFSTFARSSGTDRSGPEWSLHECSEEEFQELSRFYSHHSGGLMLDAFGLVQKRSDGESLSEVYAGLGFMRQLNKYALTRKGELKAVLIVNLSEPALNLSGLLHCMKVLITDSRDLQFDTVYWALSELAGKYELEEFPVLIYPFSYLEENHVLYQKRYRLWILNLKGGGGDAFMEFMQRRFRACYGSPRKLPPG